ncbi:AAA family ATPase [Robinsoniella peoriensis]|uniref:Cytochrome c biogenesis protein CcmA n=1 Tax=Robinsoniella peoriensis TaxID=180332 RepID=A0A4U8Q1D8_9FIRM|nr:AAA family ATPase [Robinsoniella peoriensis]TLC98088.1 cytochrome c biogenesis protein CcmA [Robinsoniella peoriensis]
MDHKYIRSIKIEWEKTDQDAYYRDIKALASIKELDFHQNITFFVGENGSGKSTLLEAIAVAYGFNPEGGSVHYNFSSNDTHTDLWKHLRIVKGIRKAKDGFFLRAESFYNVATKMEELAKTTGGGIMMDPAFLSGYGGKSLHHQSHGESFLAIVQNRFRGDGVYILDEPEAALSPQRQLTLLLYISQLAKEGSQFIIATHSPVLLGMPDAGIYSFDADSVLPIAYEDAECYQVMEMFINHRKVILDRLLNGDEI